jgi:hypothetical protein
MLKSDQHYSDIHRSIPMDPLEKFICLVSQTQFKTAAKLYHESPSSQLKFLQFMRSIPWRISCEYRFHDGKLEWFQSWIKLGWWAPNHIEIATEHHRGKWSKAPPTGLSLNKWSKVPDKWSLDPSKERPNEDQEIPSNQYYAVVWESNVPARDPSTIEIDEFNMFKSIPTLIILGLISIFFSKVSPTASFYTLQTEPFYESDILLEPQIDIGSFQPSSISHNLDTTRKPIFHINNTDDTRHTFYQGVTHGDYFIPNK